MTIDKTNRPRLIVAGVSSGAGKTTVVIGLMAALREAGLVVQGFKVGPDYIDPAYHSAVTGRASRNLDSWMLGEQGLREVFDRASADADISVIEGVMGMFDGKDPLSNQGSAAELSLLLDAPILLVVDVSAMARSAAAIVKGFQLLDSHIRVAGVVLNRVAGESHFRLVQKIIEAECQIPVVGFLPYDATLDIPERQLGLVSVLEREDLPILFHNLGEAVAQTVDLSAIRTLAGTAGAWQAPIRTLFPSGIPRVNLPITLAVARDAAFHFYYPENIELLAWHGAQVIYFSPLAGEPVPESASGLYIGGGFPEEFALQLSNQKSVMDSLHDCAQLGMPILAECGGFMALTRTLITVDGQHHDMAGVIPAVVTMRKRLTGFGYREVTADRDCVLLKTGEKLRGHKFHYSAVTYDDGVERWAYTDSNLLAGYTHFHFGSNPAAVTRFLAACHTYKTDGKMV